MKASTTATSLRERSKARRREAIRRAGMRLFAEQGYDGTTIAEIADAAEVARRTVMMYFPAKADIALSVTDEVAGRLVDVVRARSEKGFLDAIDEWLTGEADTLDPELAALMTAMHAANPALCSLGSDRIAGAVRVCGAALTAETGLPPDHPMRVVIDAAVGTAITRYFTTVLPVSRDPRLHASFMAVLRAVVTSAR